MTYVAERRSIDNQDKIYVDSYITATRRSNNLLVLQLNRMRLLITLFFTLTSFWGFVQEKGQITIVGRVVDTDNIPLIGATILDTITKKGTTTNKQGIFYLTLPKQATTIYISYLGYYALEKKMTRTEIDQSKKDTVLLAISLKPKTEELTEVEIRAANIARTYDKPSTLILDYDFHPEGLFLLLSEGNQYKLRLIDGNSNTLKDIAIRNNPEKLFRDCFGNLHILYADTVYQIYGDQSDLSLMNGFPIRKFEEYLLPCVAAYDDVLFFEDYGLHNQSIIYYLIEKNSKKRKFVQEVVDKESLTAIDDYYRETMAEAGIAPSTVGDNSLAQQDFARKVEKKVWFYQLTLSRPIYNPLCKVRDSIFIFNHIVDSAFVLNKQGELQRTFPIDYQYKNGWKNEIIIDYSGEEIYVKCVRGGLAYLLQIDPDSGQIVNEFKLKGHVFPDKIKVRDGFAYYLYNEKNESGRMNIYRQKIK